MLVQTLDQGIWATLVILIFPNTKQFLGKPAPANIAATLLTHVHDFRLSDTFDIFSTHVLWIQGLAGKL